MPSIVSHTLVRNGKPFIGLVLRQVIPFVNRCLVTVSEKSTDGTLRLLRELEREFPKKIVIDFENVKKPGELTRERQKQVEKTFEDWILFLDDDDFWPTEALEEMVGRIRKDEDVDGYSVNPYQLIDQYTYDSSWYNKFFLKWFKNQPGINYRHPWPRDMIYLNDTLLYWKVNNRVPRIETRFFHLSYLKADSFRNEKWAKKFEHKVGKPLPIPKEAQNSVWQIYEQLK